MVLPLVQGFLLGFSLIFAIGAQNIFVFRQGLLGRFVFPVVIFCSLSDTLLIFVGIFVMLISLRFKYYKRCAYVLILLLFIWYFYVPPARVIAIDVGQGDATLIINGFQSILIDTGGVKNKQPIALTSIIPVLNFYGINTLDALVLTHMDLDHIGGLNPLIHRGVQQIFSPDSLNLKHHIHVNAPMKILGNDLIMFHHYIQYLKLYHSHLDLLDCLQN